jgi:hypothetical protein
MIRNAARAALAGALCLTSFYAFAEPGKSGRLSREEAEAACTSDVFRLCAGSIPNEGKIVACLKMNKSRLSQGCRKVFSGN